MKHSPIAQAGPGLTVSPEMLDTLATQGLRELAHAPIVKVARALAHFDRDQLGIAIEIMVAMLDAADGDPDAEPITWTEDPIAQHDTLVHDDDEEDDPAGQHDEDELNTGFHLLNRDGPGCPISDAPELAGDEEDGQFAEDEEAARFERMKDGPGCLISDPDKAADDGPCDEPFQDLEPEEPLCPAYGLDQSSGPLLGSSPLVIDRAILRDHRDRIRSESCDRFTRFGQSNYRLRPSSRMPTIKA